MHRGERARFGSNFNYSGVGLTSTRRSPTQTAAFDIGCFDGSPRKAVENRSRNSGAIPGPDVADAQIGPSQPNGGEISTRPFGSIVLMRCRPDSGATGAVDAGRLSE